ncbi:uncharacterized protein [Channa argus]|uniref:uncharacterized protein n=1 Tax=Channa argus TaxID=215402 RepID=UPI002945F077|nr:hypothetical protein Q8A73_009357 [Channa argus]
MHLWIMWIIFLAVGVVAVQAFPPPSAAAESPSALQCNITQLQRLLGSSKCDLLWDIQNTFLSCRCSTNPNITTAIKLYNTSSETGHLWFRNITVPNCSSIAPPARFSCAVCFDQFLHVVCSNLRTEDGMVELEKEDQTIDTIKCGCPRSLGVDQLMAPNLSALSCRVTSLSSEWNRYQLFLEPKFDTKWEKQNIDWEETSCTVNCTFLMDEDHPANHTSQGSSVEAGRQKSHFIGGSAAAAVFLLVVIGLVCFFKYRKISSCISSSYTQAD